MEKHNDLENCTHIKSLKTIYLEDTDAALWVKNGIYKVVGVFKNTGFADVKNEQGAVITIPLDDENFTFTNQKATTENQ